MLDQRTGRFYLSWQTSCKAKRLVWNPISCILAVGRRRYYEIREIYTSLTMKIALQPAIVSYTNDDNSSCSCQGECAEDKTFGSPVAVAGGGVFVFPSLYPDPAHTSEHRLMSLTTCGKCRLIMCPVWRDLQCMVQRCHEQVLTLTLLPLTTGKSSIWLHLPLQFPKAQVINLSSLTEQLLLVLTLLWNN